MVQLPSPARTACKLVLPDTTVAALLVLSVTCQPNLGMRGCKPSSANDRAAATGDVVPIGPAAPLLVKEDTPKFSRVGHTGGVIAGVDDFDAELVVVHPPRITVATASPTQVPTRTVLHTYILPRGFIELSDHVSELRKGDRNWARPATTEGKRTAAQVGYALALYEQCFRAPIADTWPLVQLVKRASLKKLFASIRDDVLDDLIELTDLFIGAQPDLLAANELVFNPTFDASLLLGGADGDLIADRRLLDIKTKLGGEIARTDFWQLLGYTLGDFRDAFGITEVSFYFSRQGIQVAWDIGTLMELMSGSPQDLDSMRQRFRETLEKLGAARIAERESLRVAPRAAYEVGVTAGLIEPIVFGPVTFTRDRPTEWIRRSLALRPMLSGKGKWHVAYADNRYVRRPAEIGTPDTMPSCGVQGLLDTSVKTVRPRVGSLRGDWPETLCSRCLDMTGDYFYPANRYREPVVGPPERWRFHEPAKRGQRWHITRADFYAQDVVRDGETSCVCNAYGDLKPGGEVIAVAVINRDDPKYCRHCLRMVALGGHVH